MLAVRQTGAALAGSTVPADPAMPDGLQLLLMQEQQHQQQEQRQQDQLLREEITTLTTRTTMEIDKEEAYSLYMVMTEEYA